MNTRTYADQEIVLVRHAETEWSLTGQHTGITDLALTDEGRRKAERLAEGLAGRDFDLVLTSPLQRATETCAIVGLREQAEVLPELVEWDYGEYEGLTTPEIRDRDPGWVLWTDGAPGGETPAEVEHRVDRIVDLLRERDRDTAVFAHGHVLRALAVRWIGLPIADGRLLRLSTGTLSTLGWKRELRVIDVWNSDAHLRA